MKHPRGIEKRDVWMALAVLSLVLLVFGIPMKGVFLWDDVIFIEQNALLHDLSSVKTILTSSDAVGTGLQNPYYRPVTTFTFLVDHFLWDGDPWGFRLTNLLFHAAACVALFFAARRFMGPWAAFFAALIFSVHPANSEPVAYISARADQICGLFTILSFALFVDYDRDGNRGRFAWSLVFFALAVLSKIVALVLVVVLPFYLFATGKGWRRIIGELYPFFIVGALFMAVSEYVTVVDGFTADPLTTRLASAGVFLVKYLRYALFPVSLKVFYPESVRTTFADLQVIGSWLFLFAVAIACLKYLKKFPTAVIGVIWYFVALMPVSGAFILLSPALIADRYLYIPLLGLSLSLGWGIDQLMRSEIYQRNQMQLKACAAICIVAASVYTAYRVSAWKSELSFWSEAVSQAPKEFFVLNNYGLALMKAERYAEADTVFYRLKSSGDSHPHVDMSLALSAMHRNELDRAEAHIAEALRKDGDNPWYLALCGRISYLKGNLPFALRATEASLRHNPYGTEALATMEMIRGTGTRSQ